MNRLTFDQFKELVDSIEVPAQRLGIFNVKINNNNKRYYFECLKVNQSYNNDVYGFGLNHYGWFHQLPKQSFKRSKFHDEEDVSITIERSEFIYAVKSDNFNEINVSTKNFTLQINW